MQFVAQAVDGSDVATVAAVIHAQPFLSELAPESHAILLASVAAQFAPVDNAQLAATNAALQRLTPVALSPGVRVEVYTTTFQR